MGKNKVHTKLRLRYYTNQFTYVQTPPLRGEPACCNNGNIRQTVRVHCINVPVYWSQSSQCNHPQTHPIYRVLHDRPSAIAADPYVTARGLRRAIDTRTTQAANLSTISPTHTAVRPGQASTPLGLVTQHQKKKAHRRTSAHGDGSADAACPVRYRMPLPPPPSIPAKDPRTGK